MSSHLVCLFVSWCVIARVLAQIPEAPFTVPTYDAQEGFFWPGSSTWAALNSTLGGRLQALRPWAAICYTNDPLYDPVKCRTILSDYRNDYKRESIPSALLWPNWESCGHHNGCGLNYTNPQPVSDETCHQGTTPPYSITITSAEDASDIVNWAASHNVTLTIKNTGHDYLGRSARPFSLQVLTHELNSIEYIPDFVPQGSSAVPVQAITIGAGAQMDAIYLVAEENNVLVVLGTCVTVGAAGGYMQGGGHSVLSPTYGLAVDNILEVEIVTADGIIRTVNSIQDPDLFWAVCGGGAGNWGIVTSVTFATFPSTAISSSTIIITPNPTQNSRILGVNFIALVGKYQNHMIDSGVTSTLFLGSSYSVNFLWPAGKASASLLYPLFEDIRALSDNYTVLSNITQENMYPSISAAILEDLGPAADATSPYGSSTQASSRLIPRSALESDESVRSVAEAIWKGLEIASAPVEGVDHEFLALLYGGMPAVTREQVNRTGANPGLYDAAWLLFYSGSWSPINVSQSAYLSLSRAIYNAVNPITALGVTSAYQNEASVGEENWKEAFFGYKYDELLEIKQKYDPTNFFTTYKAVGSDPDSAMYSCYHDQQPDMVPGILQYTHLFT